MTKILNRLLHSPLHNYIVPGLTSWMIFDKGAEGKLRMFESTREQHEFITPHSHRFGFSAYVIEGSVLNTLWVQDEEGDPFMMTLAHYLEKPGDYRHEQLGVAKYVGKTTLYKEGAWYSMGADEIHSIRFARDTKVLFVEGRNVATASIYLEPVVDGEHIPTMKTEPWMFRGEKA